MDPDHDPDPGTRIPTQLLLAAE